MNRFTILLSFLLMIPAVGFCDRYQLLVTDELEDNAYLGIESEAFKGIDLFLQTAFEDRPDSYAHWKASYYGNERVTTVPHNYKYGVRYRIPKERIFNSRRYPGMRFFDLVIRGIKPGWFGKTWLGKTWLGRHLCLGHEEFRFIERFYFNEDNAMAQTINVSYGGNSLLREIRRDRKEPLVVATMLPYDAAFDVYFYRVTGLTPQSPGYRGVRWGVGLVDNADETDGTDNSSLSATSDSQYSATEILSTLFVLSILATSVAIDSTLAVTSSSGYELLYSLSNRGLLR